MVPYTPYVRVMERNLCNVTSTIGLSDRTAFFMLCLLYLYLSLSILFSLSLLRCRNESPPCVVGVEVLTRAISRSCTRCTRTSCALDLHITASLVIGSCLSRDVRQRFEVCQLYVLQQYTCRQLLLIGAPCLVSVCRAHSLSFLNNLITCRAKFPASNMVET